ncbi:MAG: HAD family hydrolase [Planctomycetota bacterium]|nr:HAD family hydrolase [Planctomycetota bacterium]MCX8040141.1 HAD family hydrolase [Planctomycetota bacterium]MDW8373401.1 HAD family hydrolase [Planctomycetota bacterium]
MIRCITFDWGDTLVANWGMPYLATERRVFARLHAELTALGHPPPAGWAEQCIAELQAEWQRTADPASNPEQEEMDFRALMRRWLAAAGADPDAGPVRAAADRAFDRMTDTVMPYADAAPALASLHRRYRIGIVSHVPWPGDACRRWFVRHGLAPFVDFYSLSCDVGRIKPHPAHYADAIRQAGCAPHEILHVGDHPVRDIAGGRACGLRVCLRRTERIYPEAQLDACAPDAEILHLSEIAEIAARL